MLDWREVCTECDGEGNDPVFGNFKACSNCRGTGYEAAGTEGKTIEDVYSPDH